MQSLPHRTSPSSLIHNMSGAPVQFRIMAGSYEHNLLCLSLILGKEPVFQPIFHFQAHSLSIKCMDIAKRYLVTGSNDEHIRIYDLQKRKELGNLLSHQGTVTTLRFSDEKHEAGVTEKSGKWLISGSEDGKIIVWRTKDWEVFGTLKGHQGKVNDVAIHPSGRVAISVSQDYTVRLWNLMTAKKAAVLKIKGKIHLGQAPEKVAWSQSGEYFVVGLLSQILVYSTSSATMIRRIKFASTLMCMQVAVIDGEEWLITGNGKGLIEFYKMSKLCEEGGSPDEQETLEAAFSLRGHSNRVKDITVFSNPTETAGKTYLISVSSDGKIVVWDIQEKTEVAVYDSGERLNCVSACSESVEKSSTMKRRLTEDDEPAPESEYETDGEEIKKVMKPKKKKKNQKSKVSVTLE